MTNTILKILIAISFLGVLFSCLATAKGSPLEQDAYNELRTLLLDETPIAHVSIDRSDIQIEFVPTQSAATVVADTENVEIEFVATK